MLTAEKALEEFEKLVLCLERQIINTDLTGDVGEVIKMQGRLQGIRSAISIVTDTDEEQET